MTTSHPGRTLPSAVPRSSRDNLCHGCPIQAGPVQCITSPSADLGAHSPDPADSGELRTRRGPRQGGAGQPAQAVGDQSLQVLQGSPSHAGAHCPFSPFNSQHQSPWGMTLGEGGRLPWRHPTVGWQQLVVLNPFCRIQPEVSFPHCFLPLDVCSEAWPPAVGSFQRCLFGALAHSQICDCVATVG